MGGAHARRVEPDAVERARTEVLDHDVGVRPSSLPTSSRPPGVLKSTATLSLLRLTLRK